MSPEGPLPSTIRHPVTLGWFLNPYFQVGVGAVLVAASELLLKKGASATAQPGSLGGWFGIPALASIWTWLGIASYVLSFLSWLHVLRFLPLSIAFPLINIVHVLVPLGAWMILREPVSLQRWAGIGLILGGILIMMRPIVQAEAKL